MGEEGWIEREKGEAVVGKREREREIGGSSRGNGKRDERQWYMISDRSQEHFRDPSRI